MEIFRDPIWEGISAVIVIIGTCINVFLLFWGKSEADLRNQIGRSRIIHLLLGIVITVVIPGFSIFFLTVWIAARLFSATGSTFVVAVSLLSITFSMLWGSVWHAYYWPKILLYLRGDEDEGP